MSVQPMDGLYGRLHAPLVSTDDAIVITPTVFASLQTISEGEWTYLVLRDGVAFEIVKYTGGTTGVPIGKCFVAVPVQRGVNGVRQNFGPVTTVSYEVVTPVVEDLIAERLPSK